MRHLHASDVKFLEAFRDTAAGAAQTVCAVGVLSRSDEIGSGRIDSLLSAGKVARRYERDGDLASLVLGGDPGRRPRRRRRPHAARERVRRVPRTRRSRARRPGAPPRVGRPLHEGIRRHDAEHCRAHERCWADSGSSESAWPPPSSAAAWTAPSELVRGDGAAERPGRAAAVRPQPVPHSRDDAEGARRAARAREADPRQPPRRRRRDPRRHRADLGGRAHAARTRAACQRAVRRPAPA